MPLRNLLITFLLFFFNIIVSASQVLIQDSLALVSLYNNTGGASWYNKTNWLSGSVSTWEGVSLVSDRVNSIVLVNNNLSGSLPDALCDLTKLQYLSLANNQLTGNLPSCIGNFTIMNTFNFSNNNLTGSIPSSITSCAALGDLFIESNQFDDLPSLLSIVEITNVYIQNNKFSFEDIEPNMGLFNFKYTPQDSVDTAADTIIDIFKNVSLYTNSGGTHNVYQWFFNGTPLENSAHIQGAKTAALTINRVLPSDSGIYNCTVTNSIVPLLTLQRRDINLRVNDNRLQQQIFFPSSAPLVCGDLPFKIGATNSSGLPLEYSLVSGSAFLGGDTLHALTKGEIVIKAFNPGDDFYRPVSKDTLIVVQNPGEVITIILNNAPPIKEGDILNLSATTISGADYTWLSPKGVLYKTQDLSIPDLGTDDSGYYKISIGSNLCIYFIDSVKVDIAKVDKEIYIYELITPNGDGKNETFYVQNIEKYPGNEVMIYNAWGQLIFKANPYNNDWSGEDFPAGTYYYTISIKDTGFNAKGNLYLRK